MYVRKLRLFREEHQISLRELSEACHLSHQRLSLIELEGQPVSPYTEQKILNGLERVLCQRRVSAEAATEDFTQSAASLMDNVEVKNREL